MSFRVIGPYEIHEQLGKGGIGEVYAGVDQLLGRPVAIKALRPEFSRDRGFLERFRGEATNLARLNHPNITTLFSLHKEGDELFMVMELVRGNTLEAILGKAGRLGVRECLAIMAQTVAGLSYAHRMGVIHRDIKPANLMVTDSGLLKIMDFGIARIQGSQRMTRQGDLIGTLAYMSPEQLQGAEGDARSDLYSLSMVLYELLSGNCAFNATSEYELIRAQVEQRPPPLAGQVPDLDPNVESVMMRALAKKPEERYASVDEFGRALGAAAIQGEAADIVKETVVARWGALPPPATRLMSTGGSLSLEAPAQATAAQSAVADRPGQGAKKATLPLLSALPPAMRMPAMVLGGVAAVLLAGLGYVVLASGPTAKPVVAEQAPPAATASAAKETQEPPAPAHPLRSAAAEPAPAAKEAPASPLPSAPASPPASAVAPPASPPAAPAPAAATSSPSATAPPAAPAASASPPATAPTQPATTAPPAAPPSTPVASASPPAAAPSPASAAAPTATPAAPTTPVASTNPPAQPPAAIQAPAKPDNSLVIATNTSLAPQPAAPAAGSQPAATGTPSPAASGSQAPAATGLPSSEQTHPPQVASLPPNTAQPPAVSGATPDIEGEVSAVLNSAALVVAGKVVNLYGIRGETGQLATAMQHYIEQMGNRVSCFARPGRSFECHVGKVDLAEAAVLNGAARVRPGAPSKYRVAEQQAKAARRGIWAM